MDWEAAWAKAMFRRRAACDDLDMRLRAEMGTARLRRVRGTAIRVRVARERAERAERRWARALNRARYAGVDEIVTALGGRVVG